MSATWTITAVDGNVFTVVADVTTSYSAVITGAVTDEIFGSVDLPALTVEVARADLQTKTAKPGLYAITGYPARSFPQLSSTSYTIGYMLMAPGFRDYPLTVTIPVNASFPVIAPNVAMRRLPVRLQGRVVLDATGQPAPGALVLSVDNPTPPSPPPPPPAPHNMLLRSPLYSAHPANATVQQVTLTPVGSAQLTQPAAAGSTTLTLSTTAGLGGAAFVQIETPSLTLIEYATVASVGPALGQVQLQTALNRSYAAGAATTVTFMTATPAGTVANLLLDANWGDGILVTNALIGASTLVIDSGTPTMEFHEVGAVADSNGYYGFDGVGRVQELFLQANSTGTPVPWAIEFDQATNVVDLEI